MNVLVVHAHPESLSFTTAMRDTVVETLQRQGHSVVVSDLYAMAFNPVASASDFSIRARDEYLVYALEQRHGYQNGTLSPDIAAEVEKVLAADLLIFSFPIYWFSVPAMLKGWIDRVFLSGPLYGGKRFYDQGGMRGKRAWVLATLGGREHMFGPDAIHGELDGMLSHILRGTLAYVGYDVLQPFYGHHVPYLRPEQRDDLLLEVRAAAEDLASRPVLSFVKLGDFDDRLYPLHRPAEVQQPAESVRT